MGKILKPGKVVIVLGGRYAGRKGIVMKTLDEGTHDKPFGQAIVAGIDRYPRRVTRRMNKAKVHKNCRVKAFVKVRILSVIVNLSTNYFLFLVCQLQPLAPNTLHRSGHQSRIKVQHQGSERSRQVQEGALQCSHAARGTLQGGSIQMVLPQAELLDRHSEHWNI